MKKRKVVRQRILFLLSLLLVSCATEQEIEDHFKKICHEKSAYSQGVEDAENGRPMDSSEFKHCSVDMAPSAKSSYVEGYQSVSNNLARNIQDIVGLSRYECTTKVFGKDFSSTKKSMDKARNAVQELCQAEFHQMHCNSIHCQKVQ
jgi:hypothetical protein